MRPAKCDKDAYTLYILAEPKRAHCTHLSRIMDDMSHDAVNRFLKREHFTPKDLFDENKPFLRMEGCTLSVDDCVLDKPYSDPRYNDFVTWLYSGLHHKTVKGIGLVTLFCCDTGGKRFPVNYRIYEAGSKTKNELFQEMVDEVLSWGVRPAIVTADAWYASADNMKFLDARSIAWLFGLKENRIVSETPHDHFPLSQADIPPEGKVLHLRGYKHVRVFRRVFKNDGPKHYATSLQDMPVGEFERQHAEHWSIETYHRAIKQLCNAETSMVRSRKGQENHLFCVLRAFSFLEKQVVRKRIQSWYTISNALYDEAIRSFIRSQGVCFVNA